MNAEYSNYSIHEYIIKSLFYKDLIRKTGFLFPSWADCGYGSNSPGQIISMKEVSVQNHNPPSLKLRLRQKSLLFFNQIQRIIVFLCVFILLPLESYKNYFL